MPVRILIVDDHAVVREGLKTILEAEGNLKIVGEAGDGREALNKAEELKPDVIFMDITMPDLSGIETTRLILERLPAVRIIILSMHASNEYVIRAIRAGARAYILKESAGRNAVYAVRAVLRGRQYFGEGVEAPQMKRSPLPLTPYPLPLTPYPLPLTPYPLPLTPYPLPLTPLDRLSRRERETLQFVVEGYTNAAIAERLNVSPKSVETYRSRLMLKLGINNVPALVIFAIQHGVITVP